MRGGLRHGAGRKPTGEAMTHAITIRVNEEQRERFDELGADWLREHLNPAQGAYELLEHQVLTLAMLSDNGNGVPEEGQQLVERILGAIRQRMGLNEGQ